MSEQEPGQNLNSFSEKPEPWSNESISWLPSSSSSCPLHPIPYNKKKRSSKKKKIWLHIFSQNGTIRLAYQFFLVIIFFLLLQNTSAIIHSHFIFWQDISAQNPPPPHIPVPSMLRLRSLNSLPLPCNLF